jgi:phage host-nuclease inhibitor protein Gam
MEKEISAINDIRKYIDKLNDNLNVKVLQNTNLVQEISNYKSEINNLKSNISELNEQVKMLKLASQIEGNEVGSTKDVKLMINEMVREIDKCIALLNK